MASDSTESATMGRMSRAPSKGLRAIEGGGRHMVDENNHSARVDAWLAKVAKDLPAAQLLAVFEQGFAAVWQRTHQTLGDITLTAITDRVLYTATESFPWLASLEIERTGLQCQGLLTHTGSVHRDQLASGLRFVLIEFLTVIGNLTAEILTPALHSELSKAASSEKIRDEKESHGAPQNPESSGKSTQS